MKNLTLPPVLPTFLLALALPVAAQAAAHQNATTTSPSRITPATKQAVSATIPATPPALQVLDGSIPAALQGQSAAVSLALVNPTSQTIIIRGATSPVAQLIRLQRISKTPEGLMQMTDLPRLVLPPHTNAVLAPAATELRLLNLSSDLKAGYETPLTLIFDNLTTKTIRLHIKD